MDVILSDFVRSSPVRDVWMRVGSAERAAVGAEEKRDRTPSEGDPRFSTFLTLFRLKFLYQEYFEYVFLLSVYRNTKGAGMETEARWEL